MPEDLTLGDLSSPLLNIVNPTPDEHTITTRAVDTSGKVQPTADDLQLVNKITY